MCGDFHRAMDITVDKLKWFGGTRGRVWKGIGMHLASFVLISDLSTLK
jgi:hypothetical protein